MHIAFLSPEYPHPEIINSAGIGTSIYNLAQELVKQGHQATVFVYSQQEDAQFDDNGVNIVKIAYKKYLFFGWYLYRKHIARKINYFISKYHIELLEAPDWTGITAFMKLNCPIVIRIHGSDTYFCHLEEREQKWKNKWFEKTAIKNADSIIAVSEFAGNLTKQLFNIKQKIQTLYNGIDVEKFEGDNGVAENVNRIVYFGSVIRKKGVLELAYIFNSVVHKNSKASLLVIGKDVMDIREQVSTKELFLNILDKEAKDKVTFISEVPYAKIKDYINTASVVVLPSFAEAFPMTWLEAMSMKKALVTSDIGWAKELMVDGKTGYTIHPKDHEKYSEAILKLLNEKELRIQFGESARKRIQEHFSKEHIVRKNILFYASIIDLK